MKWLTVLVLSFALMAFSALAKKPATDDNSGDDGADKPTQKVEKAKKAKKNVEDAPAEKPQMTKEELAKKIKELLALQKEEGLTKKQARQLEALIAEWNERLRKEYEGYVLDIDKKIGKEMAKSEEYRFYGDIYLKMLKDPKLEKLTETKREWYEMIAKILLAMEKPAALCVAYEESRKLDMSKLTPAGKRRIEELRQKTVEQGAPAFEKLIQKYNEVYKDRDKYKYEEKEKKKNRRKSSSSES